MPETSDDALKPLSPSTEAQYRGVLERAFGTDTPPFKPDAAIKAWPETSKALLRAAIRRKYREAELDAGPLLREIPAKWQVAKVVQIPSEEEALRFEEAARMRSPGHYAAVMLPLVMGLRSAEVISLSRRAVERALRHGELAVLRKGGKEQMLPAKHARAVFQALLSAPKIGTQRTPWALVGDVLSASGTARGAYQSLHRIVRSVGEEAWLANLRPHLLRHAFATRMARDGAPLPVIQWALGHSQVQTTMKYVHPSSTDVQKYVRDVTL